MVRKVEIIGYLANRKHRIVQADLYLGRQLLIDQLFRGLAVEIFRHYITKVPRGDTELACIKRQHMLRHDVFPDKTHELMAGEVPEAIPPGRGAAF